MNLNFNLADTLSALATASGLTPPAPDRPKPSKGPHTIGKPLSGRALRRAMGERKPVDLYQCRRKYSHGRRGARAAARTLSKMARGMVLDLDQAVLLSHRLEDLRVPKD